MLNIHKIEGKIFLANIGQEELCIEYAEPREIKGKFLCLMPNELKEAHRGTAILIKTGKQIIIC